VRFLFVMQRATRSPSTDTSFFEPRGRRRPETLTAEQYSPSEGNCGDDRRRRATVRLAGDVIPTDVVTRTVTRDRHLLAVSFCVAHGHAAHG